MTQTAPETDGADDIFRLAVYEAGHAIAARALGLRIVSLTMLPRPPVMSTEKTFSGSSFKSFVETLEIRIIELLGGQIAEAMICGNSTCCSGDISRIDELTRMIAAFYDNRKPEDIWFDLEDMAEEIFATEGVKAALMPLALVLHASIRDGHEMMEGEEIEAILDDYMPRPKKKGILQRLSGIGRKR